MESYQYGGPGQCPRYLLPGHYNLEMSQYPWINRGSVGQSPDVFSHVAYENPNPIYPHNRQIVSYSRAVTSYSNSEQSQDPSGSHCEDLVPPPTNSDSVFSNFAPLDSDGNLLQPPDSGYDPFVSNITVPMSAHSGHHSLAEPHLSTRDQTETFSAYHSQGFDGNVSPQLSYQMSGWKQRVHVSEQICQQQLAHHQTSGYRLSHHVDHYNVQNYSTGRTSAGVCREKPTGNEGGQYARHIAPCLMTGVESRDQRMCSCQSQTREMETPSESHKTTPHVSLQSREAIANLLPPLSQIVSHVFSKQGQVRGHVEPPEGHSLISETTHPQWLESTQVNSHKAAFVPRKENFANTELLSANRHNWLRLPDVSFERQMNNAINDQHGPVVCDSARHDMMQEAVRSSNGSTSRLDREADCNSYSVRPRQVHGAADYLNGEQQRGRTFNDPHEGSSKNLQSKSRMMNNVCEKESLIASILKSPVHCKHVDNTKHHVDYEIASDKEAMLISEPEDYSALSVERINEAISIFNIPPNTMQNRTSLTDTTTNDFSVRIPSDYRSYTETPSNSLDAKLPDRGLCVSLFPDTENMTTNTGKEESLIRKKKKRRKKKKKLFTTCTGKKPRTSLESIDAAIERVCAKLDYRMSEEGPRSSPESIDAAIERVCAQSQYTSSICGSKLRITRVRSGADKDCRVTEKACLTEESLQQQAEEDSCSMRGFQCSANNSAHTSSNGGPASFPEEADANRRYMYLSSDLSSEGKAFGGEIEEIDFKDLNSPKQESKNGIQESESAEQNYSFQFFASLEDTSTSIPCSPSENAKTVLPASLKCQAGEAIALCHSPQIPVPHGPIEVKRRPKAGELLAQSRGFLTGSEESETEEEVKIELEPPESPATETRHLVESDMEEGFVQGHLEAGLLIVNSWTLGKGENMVKNCLSGEVTSNQCRSCPSHDSVEKEITIVWESGNDANELLTLENWEDMNLSMEEPNDAEGTKQTDSQVMASKQEDNMCNLQLQNIADIFVLEDCERKDAVLDKCHSKIVGDQITSEKNNFNVKASEDDSHKERLCVVGLESPVTQNLDIPVTQLHSSSIEIKENIEHVVHFPGKLSTKGQPVSDSDFGNKHTVASGMNKLSEQSELPDITMDQYRVFRSDDQEAQCNSHSNDRQVLRPSTNLKRKAEHDQDDKSPARKLPRIESVHVSHAASKAPQRHIFDQLDTSLMKSQQNGPSDICSDRSLFLSTMTKFLKAELADVTLQEFHGIFLTSVKNSFELGRYFTCRELYEKVFSNIQADCFQRTIVQDLKIVPQYLGSDTLERLAKVLVVEGLALDEQLPLVSVADAERLYTYFCGSDRVKKKASSASPIKLKIDAQGLKALVDAKPPVGVKSNVDAKYLAEVKPVVANLEGRRSSLQNESRIFRDVKEGLSIAQVETPQISVLSPRSCSAENSGDAEGYKQCEIDFSDATVGLHPPVIKGGILDIFGPPMRYIGTGSSKEFVLADMCKAFEEEVVLRHLRISSLESRHCTRPEKDFIERLGEDLPGSDSYFRSCTVVNIPNLFNFMEEVNNS